MKRLVKLAIILMVVYSLWQSGWLSRNTFAAGNFRYTPAKVAQALENELGVHLTMDRQGKGDYHIGLNISDMITRVENLLNTAN